MPKVEKQKKHQQRTSNVQQAKSDMQRATCNKQPPEIMRQRGCKRKAKSESGQWQGVGDLYCMDISE